MSAVIPNPPKGTGSRPGASGLDQMARGVACSRAGASRAAPPLPPRGPPTIPNGRPGLAHAPAQVAGARARPGDSRPAPPSGGRNHLKARGETETAASHTGSGSLGHRKWWAFWVICCLYSVGEVPVVKFAPLLLETMALETVPKDLRHLRACLLCSLVKVCIGILVVGAMGTQPGGRKVERDAGSCRTPLFTSVGTELAVLGAGGLTCL